MSKTAIAQSRAKNKTAQEKVPAMQKILRMYEPKDFSMISNAGVRNKRLSLEAKGMLWTILALPEDWSFSTAWARHELGLGRDKLYRILDELKAAGHIRYCRPKDSRGRMMAPAYYVVGDPRSFAENEQIEPLPENPDVDDHHVTENPDTAEPTSGKSGRILSSESSTKHSDSQKAPRRDFEKSGGEGEVEGQWRRRLELYRQKGQWAPFNRWGPKIGEPGCIVPPDMARLFVDDPKSFMGNAKKGKKPDSDKPFAKDTNGFQRIGTLNLPGTSHD